MTAIDGRQATIPFDKEVARWQKIHGTIQLQNPKLLVCSSIKTGIYICFGTEDVHKRSIHVPSKTTTETVGLAKFHDMDVGLQ